MVWIIEGATLVVGCKREGWMWRPGRIEVAESCLSSVGSGKPAEEMVKGSIFHHDEHDMFDARSMRFGERFHSSCGLQSIHR